MRLVSLALLASGATLSAQLPAQTQPSFAARETLRSQMGSAQVVLLGSASQGCPVAFTAQRYPGGGLVQTRKGSNVHDLEYRLSFEAGVDKPKAIVQARVTLHGLDGARVLSVGRDGEGSATEEFSLSPAAGHDHGFHSILYARKLTGVQSVELNDLTFADGTRWHEAASAPCRIMPDGFMQVAAGR